MLSASVNKILISTVRLEHGEEIHHIIKSAFLVPLEETCDGCMNASDIAEQLQRFPEGQFIALEHLPTGEEKVVGVAMTMRTSYPPTEPPTTWMDAIGSRGIANHEPNGDWLYGVEMAVSPDYHGKGIGTMLYKARFDLVRKLNLKGWYAGGMLMGYHRHADKMTAREYGEKVIRGEMRDPTVTMQLNRGFRPISVIENYLDEPPAGDAAVLIVWDNPDYKEAAS